MNTEDVMDVIEDLKRNNKKAAIARIVEAEGSLPMSRDAKYLVAEDFTIGTIGGGCLENDVYRRAKVVMNDEKSSILNFDLSAQEGSTDGHICGGEVKVLIEPISLYDDERIEKEKKVIPSLYLFGGGHVCSQVAKCAFVAGFNIHVVEDRNMYANKTRFPDAKEIHVGKIPNILKTLDVDENSYLVIITRGHYQDELILDWAVDTDAKYIGMIGSKMKILMTYGNISKHTDWNRRKLIERVHAPIGLDIGADDPGEIAISIIAEMVRFRRKKQQYMMNKRIQPILNEGGKNVQKISEG